MYHETNMIFNQKNKITTNNYSHSHFFLGWKLKINIKISTCSYVNLTIFRLWFIIDPKQFRAWEYYRMSREAQIDCF